MVLETKVLLIEDNASDAEMITRALKVDNSLNHVQHVKEGNEALDFLFGEGKYAGREINTIPQVILMDLKMPRVNGKECLMRIKMDKRTKMIPVIVLSSSGEEEDINECYDLGANGYVIKPLDSEVLHKTVSDLCSYWLSVNESPQ